MQTLQALADATALAMENVRAYTQLEQRVQSARWSSKPRARSRNSPESAERRHRAKTRFLAAASHDLRQPLQSLALLTGAMRRIATDPDVREVLEQQELAVGSASQLVNAILDVTKLDSGAIAPEIADFPLAELCEELRRELRLPPTRGWSCVSMRWRHVRSNATLVAQILRNLLSKPSSTARGLGDPELPAASAARVEVRTPAGHISRAPAPHLRRVLSVGVNARTQRNGYGLGLSIVTRLPRCWT